MIHSDDIRSIYGAQPVYTSKNSLKASTSPSHTTQLAVREAKRIIPQDIVAEKAALYGGQVNRAKVPEDSSAQVTTIYQDTIHQPKAETKKKNNTVLSDGNKCTYEEAFTYLPGEIKEVIFEFLNPKSLYAISEVSKDTNTVVKSSRSCRNKILHASAKKMALLIDLTEEKCFELIRIATEQAKNGDIKEARKTLASAKDYSCLIKDNDYYKCDALRDIATSQAKIGDTKEAKDTFNLSKDSALLIKGNRNKCKAQLLIKLR